MYIVIPENLVLLHLLAPLSQTAVEWTNHRRKEASNKKGSSNNNGLFTSLFDAAAAAAALAHSLPFPHAAAAAEMAQWEMRIKESVYQKGDLELTRGERTVSWPRKYDVTLTGKRLCITAEKRECVTPAICNYHNKEKGLKSIQCVGWSEMPASMSYQICSLDR